MESSPSFSNVSSFWIPELRRPSSHIPISTPILLVGITSAARRSAVGIHSHDELEPIRDTHHHSPPHSDSSGASSSSSSSSSTTLTSSIRRAGGRPSLLGSVDLVRRSQVLPVVRRYGLAGFLVCHPFDRRRGKKNSPSTSISSISSSSSVAASEVIDAAVRCFGMRGRRCGAELSGLRDLVCERRELERKIEQEFEEVIPGRIPEVESRILFGFGESESPQRQQPQQQRKKQRRGTMELVQGMEAEFRVRVDELDAKIVRVLGFSKKYMRGYQQRRKSKRKKLTGFSKVVDDDEDYDDDTFMTAMGADVDVASLYGARAGSSSSLPARQHLSSGGGAAAGGRRKKRRQQSMMMMAEDDEEEETPEAILEEVDLLWRQFFSGVRYGRLFRKAGLFRKKPNFRSLVYFGQVKDGGMRNGVGKEFFPDGKTVQFVGHFVADRRHGEGEEYDEEGSLIERSLWVDGKKIQ